MHVDCIFGSIYRIMLVCFFKQKTAYEMRISDWSSDVCSSDLAGVVPGGLRRGVEDRPGCGGRRAHEYGGRHPRMIDPGILQFPVFDEHPDLHRLAYHFISLHFIGAAVRGSFIAMGYPSQDPARMAWRAPGPASAAPPVPEPHPGKRADRDRKSVV